MILIGIWGFAQFEFVAVWAPGIEPAAFRMPAVIACSLLSTVVGAGLLWPPYASTAARLLLGFLCLWLVWCKGAALVRAPTVAASWESLGETAVITSAAWALAERIGGKDEARPKRLSRPGPRILYGLALIAFGASHLAYPALTASLVPSWLPWHIGWVYFTAATYIAAGAALTMQRFAWPAAALATLQMALFGLLVWLPKIVAGARDSDTLNEAAISFALAASGWILTDALRGRPADAFQAAVGKLKHG